MLAALPCRVLHHWQRRPMLTAAAAGRPSRRANHDVNERIALSPLGATRRRFSVSASIAIHDARVSGLDDGSESTLGQDGHFAGEWDAAAGTPHGQGKMLWDNGVSYEGQWAAGRFD